MADYDVVMQKIDYLDDTKHQIKDAIIEKGQPIAENDTFREYVDKIKQLSGGDIKLYSTVEEMNNDQKPKRDGELALVYNREFKPIASNMTFSSIEIPRVIHIGSTSTSSRSLSISGNGTVYSSLYVYIPSYNEETKLPNGTFNIQLRTDSITTNLRYDCSEDGLTYTFNNGTQTNDISSSNIIFDTDTWTYNFYSTLTANVINDVFIGMFNVQVVDFQGLYQYLLNHKNDYSIYCGNNLNINTDNIANFELQDYLDFKKFKDELFDLTHRPYFYGIAKLNNITNHIPDMFSMYSGISSLFIDNNKLYLYSGLKYDNELDAENAISSNTYQEQQIDFENWSYNTVDRNYTIISKTVGNETNYYLVGEELDINDSITAFNIDIMMGERFRHTNISICSPDIFNNLTMSVNYMFDYAYEDKYIFAPNQFTLNSNKELITGKSALGHNEIYTGDGTYLDLITTKEYKDYFIPELPDTRKSEYTSVLQYGSSHKYFTLVEREELACTDDLSVIPNSDAITFKVNPILVGNTTSEIYKKAYNAQYQRTFYTKNNNKLYYGYFGYNMSDKQSSSESGGIVHEEFRQIYGVLVCLDDLEIVKEVQYTSTWRPFNGYGNYHEDPEANINFLNYDFIHDEFIIFVDTGSWSWTGPDAPYLGMMRINGTTGAVTTKSWKIGRNGVPKDYAQVSALRYDLTTQRLLLPLKSYSKGDGYSITTKILKMDLSGNKSTWIQNNNGLQNLWYLGNDESFYIFEPIYYYSYSENNTTHYVLKRIDNDKQVEIPVPYSLAKTNRIIYNGYLYYMGATRLSDSNMYPLYRINLTTMTYEKYSEFSSNSMSTIFLDDKPHFVYNNKLYDIDDLTTPKYTYYNTSNMYNDVRIDGIELIDGILQGTYPRATNSSNSIDFNQNKQLIHHWKVANEFPVKHELGMIYPSSFNNNTVNGSTDMYYSIILAEQAYENTLSPKEYKGVNNMIDKINGEEIN